MSDETFTVPCPALFATKQWFGRSKALIVRFAANAVN